MPRTKKPLPARQRILESAALLFNAGGYNATSIADIQKASNVQRGSLYFHFPNKESLALEVLDQFFNSVAMALTQAIKDPGPSARDTLFGIFGTIRQKTVENDYLGGCLLGNFGQELAINEAARVRIKKFFDLLIETVAVLLAMAQKKGEISSKLEPKQAARLFVSSFHGALIELKVYKDPAVYDECMETLRGLLKNGT